MPDHMKVEFDNSLAKKVDRWVTNNGDRFIYINGANDTWSATAVPENKKRDAVWINMRGKDHGQARIKNMSPSERVLVILKLENWLDTQITDIFENEKK